MSTPKQKSWLKSIIKAAPPDLLSLRLKERVDNHAIVRHLIATNNITTENKVENIYRSFPPGRTTFQYQAGVQNSKGVIGGRNMYSINKQLYERLKNIFQSDDIKSADSVIYR